MSPVVMLVFQIGGIIAVGYFLLFRPQIQARKQADAMQAALKKGDDIVTSGGIVGRIKDIREHLVTIESGTSTLVIERSRVVKAGGSVPAGNS